jgi:hypothetical protein
MILGARCVFVILGALRAQPDEFSRTITCNNPSTVFEVVTGLDIVLLRLS